MSNKMLIDASHPEETRVAVVRGNKVEEFDFESQEKKQLRGNIYLAKVARVEPSLQAAFVDYGGNRHGFLAFSEIHPDYYQIPVADRQALLEAEAEEARASREAEEREDDDAETAEEQPKKKPRRRRSRKPKSAASEDDSAETNEESEAEAEEGAQAADADANVEAAAEAESEAQEAEVEEKPKRRSTRRKKAPAKKAEASETDAPAEEKEAEASEEEAEVKAKPKRRSTSRKKAPVKKADDASDDDTSDKDEDGNPKTMAAMVEMDEISEDLPESDSGDEEPEVEEKPKRRSTRRKKAPVKKAEAKEETEETTSEETPAEEPVAEEEASKDETSEEVAKPKRKSTRRTRKKKTDDAEEVEAKETKTDEDVSDDASSEDATEAEDAPVESVGQDDALEEVTQPKRYRRHYKIQEVIKRRQVLLVQVVKEERGNKGAALTTYLSLAGRYSVLMPNTARGGGISRKITNSSDRKRLKAIASELDVPQGMGVILRTAGASRTNEEITRDFEYLMRLWEQVRNLTLSSSAPCLVYEEGSLIKRSIRDLYDKNTGEVIVAGEDGFNEAKDFMTMLMPNAANKVKLHRDKQTIFAKYGVETHLDKMVTPQVTLKSGGYLIIDQTEALVAVDVNSGRSTREHSVEDTALQTNLEAAEEVARQLRLRDLAGLIVIDFIDMEEKRNIRAVEKKLKDCLKNDRARIQVGRISHFGLMEMSRQRMRASVLESTMDVCPMCAGTGRVRSESSIALHIFRAIEEHVSRHNKYDAVVKTTPAIAMNLLNFKRAALHELEQRYGLQIIVEASAEITGQDFEFEKGEVATGEPTSSAIGMHAGSTADAPDEDDEASEGKTRGRGRGRGRKNRDEETEEENTSDETTATDEDERPRKKRRRGKRGGRGRKPSDEDVNTETSSEEETNTTEAPEVEPIAVSEEAETVDEKPKSRSTRRKKAPITEKPASEPDNDVVSEATAEPEAETEEVEEKPKRRSTRRKKAPVEAEATHQVEAATEQQAEEPSSSDEADEKPKKTSWWNRGGGFF